jgi:acetoin utilization deacetylase AcuC-like enzyme
LWPARGLRVLRDGDIEKQLGAYCFDKATPIVKGTWSAAREAVNIALSAADAVHNGERGAFALTRPPGHHASGDVYGGYCYLNNVAVAAQWLRDKGRRPAILDVDYHHGNGTQAIFYRRNDVFFVSIHADPSFAFPLFLGYADEKGEGAGEGKNINFPLPRQTAWPDYLQVLDRALAAVKDFGADVMLVSLGLDTFEGDPMCRFKIRTEDYLRMGEAIGRAGLPCVFVFEGGYNTELLGVNTVNVLEGFQGA